MHMRTFIAALLLMKKQNKTGNSSLDWQIGQTVQYHVALNCAITDIMWKPLYIWRKQATKEYETNFYKWKKFIYVWIYVKRYTQAKHAWQKKNIKSYLWGKRGKQNWGARHKDFKIHFSVLFQGREAEVQKQI